MRLSTHGAQEKRHYVPSDELCTINYLIINYTLGINYRFIAALNIILDELT